MRNLILLTSLLLILQDNYAQTAYETLDINNISATFNNTGALFYDTFDKQFEAPKGSGVKTVYTSGLWLAGKDSMQNIHTSVATYGNPPNRDYYVGPIMDSTLYSTKSYLYDRIFKLSCQDIEKFRNYMDCFNDPNCNEIANFPNYSIPLDVIEWPANGLFAGMSNNLAPYVDVDEDGVYNPNVGDYPAIKGDLCLYFIIHDDGIHTKSLGLPLQAEIHLMAYAFKDENPAIENSIFMDYTIYNRSTLSYYDMYLGVFSDFDIGGYLDDYVATSPNLNLVYAYNGDSYDNPTGGTVGYLDTLAAQGMVLLQGPKRDSDTLDNSPLDYGLGYNDGIVDNEYMGLTNSIFYDFYNGPTGEPSQPSEYYNYLKSVWKDGSHQVFGANGYFGFCDSCVESNYIFTNIGNDPLYIGTNGIPQPSWGSIQGLNALPGDRRILASAGPFTFQAGEKTELKLAYVFARSDSSGTPLDPVRKLKAYAYELQNSPIPSCAASFPAFISKNSLKKLKVFPNPSGGVFNIMGLSGELKSLQIINVFGQTLQVIEVNDKNAVIDLSGLAPGTYFLNIENTEFERVKIIKE